MKPRIFVDSTDSLEPTFHELIPISNAIVRYTGTTLTISAPLSQNINHQLSAFGGSLYANAVLAGWGLMQMKQSELNLDCNTVVMGGDVSYERPVVDDPLCTCELPENAEQLFETLEKEGKISASMVSTFSSGGQTAMALVGRYHLKQHR